MKLPLNIKLVIILIVIGMIYTGSVGVYEKVKEVYNGTEMIKLEYTSEAQKQVTNYDAYYSMFTEKFDMTTFNEETFIQVTDIIMFSRRDGENLAWKWNQENQNIPYEEFSHFYKELSIFIEERYKDNMVIEQNKQRLVKNHNLILNTFPNNVLNKILKIEHLTYKRGYVSQETLDKFK